MRYRLETLGYERGQGYFASSTNVVALRMVVLSDDAGLHAKCADYMRRIQRSDPQWTKTKGQNILWRLRMTDQVFEFEAYAEWLRPRKITNIEVQKQEAARKMEHALQELFRNLLPVFDYLPAGNPDVCAVQAQFFGIDLADVLRGHSLDHKRIREVLGRLRHAVQQHLM